MERDVVNRIEELREIIRGHDRKYYIEAAPEIPNTNDHDARHDDDGDARHDDDHDLHDDPRLRRGCGRLRDLRRARAGGKTSEQSVKAAE